MFAYAANVANDPDWSRRIVKARVTSAPPLAEGSTFSFSMKLLHRTREYDAVVTHFEENLRCAYRADSTKTPVVDYRSFVLTRDGARFTVAIDLDGIPAMLSSLVKQRAQRQLDADLLTLKERLEQEVSGIRP